MIFLRRYKKTITKQCLELYHDIYPMINGIRYGYDHYYGEYMLFYNDMIVFSIHIIDNILDSVDICNIKFSKTGQWIHTLINMEYINPTYYGGVHSYYKCIINIYKFDKFLFGQLTKCKLTKTYELENTCLVLHNGKFLNTQHNK